MKLRPFKLTLGLIAFAALTLTGCGGGGANSIGAAAGTMVSGVAATGLAIDKGSVSLRCSTGSTAPVTTAVDGSFSVDVSNVTLPCVARVDYTDSNGASHKLHSLVKVAGNVNITPVTDMVVAKLSASGIAADVTADDVKSYTTQRIGTATQQVKTYLESKGVHTAALPEDVIGSKLAATHGASKGDSYDGVLDDIKAKLDSKGQKLADAENEMKSGNETRGLSTSTGKAGDAAAGKAVYDAMCAGCHGVRMAAAVNASKTLKAIQENEGGMGKLSISSPIADNIATYMSNGLSSTGTTTPALTTQTITFASPAAQTLGAAPFPVTVSASSGLVVTIASNTTAVCTVSGYNLTLIAAGNCSLTASQAGNASFAAANNIIVSFMVTDPSSTANPPVSTGLIPVASTGKTLYASNCVTCHGAAATGGSNVLNGANSALTIQSAITRGLGGMGGLASLSAQNLADIAAYLGTPNI